ncbi:ROK family protein, partial [Streptomyces rubrogriseus]|nr:ROK family protein [Streptomyces rubrogriseus]
MKAALAGPGGELLHQARRATGRERGPEAVVAGILDFAAELRAYGADRFGEPAR